MEVAHLLRQAGKPTVLGVNKVDTFEMQYGAPEFYKLGLGEPFILSAENGLGTGDLLDEVCSRFKKDDSGEEIEDLPRFAIVGRPNAGKSGILNAFIGEERTIVTDIPGTTRDSIYTRYNKFGKDFYLVDTAGIRKKAKVNEDTEYYSVVRSIRAIENSDVCILMIDATRGIEAQDLNIYSIIQKNKKDSLSASTSGTLWRAKPTPTSKHTRRLSATVLRHLPTSPSSSPPRLPSSVYSR